MSKINKHKALEMYRQGATYAEIARAQGVTRQAVQKFISSSKKEEPFVTGAPYCVYPEIMREMCRKHITYEELCAASSIPNYRIEGIFIGRIFPTNVDRIVIEYLLGKKFSWIKT